MKTKLIINAMGLFLMVSLFIFSSCSKTPDGNLTKEQKEQQDKDLAVSPIDDKDFAESVEDLSTVDYKEYYDQLSEHGEWVQVTPEEIGLKSGTASNESSGINGYSLTNLFGVNDAIASSDAGAALVFAWKPSTDLGVTMVAGGDPAYVPYTNGQWVNTDAGWYFKAPTPVEETVSHYGRWVNTADAGWLWVPGRVWAPAWVDWKQDDKYVSWAPLPPAVNLINGIMGVPVIDNNNYTIVERKYFIEPDVYKYNNIYYADGNRILVNEMSVTPGIVVVNNTIINRGPDVNVIQTIYGRNIDLVKIQHVRNFNDVRYSNGVYNVYTPVFTRYKIKGNSKFTGIEPKYFKKYGEWKENKAAGKEYKKEEKEIRKESKKEEKEIRKEIKKNDKGNKQDWNDNGQKNKGNENGQKNKGNENVKKNNDNGKKNNDNGQKNKGNENVKKNNDNGKKNNDNGKQNKGNDNGKKNNDNGKQDKGKK